MSNNNNTIRPKAVGIIFKEDDILLYEGNDRVNGQTFLSPLGGGMEFGETSEQTVLREMLEESGEEVRILNYLGLIEAIYKFEGKPHHQLVFVFECQFTNPQVYERPILNCNENGQPFKAQWYALKSLYEQPNLLKPKSLINLLQSREKLPTAKLIQHQV